MCIFKGIEVHVLKTIVVIRIHGTSYTHQEPDPENCFYIRVTDERPAAEVGHGSSLQHFLLIFLMPDIAVLHLEQPGTHISMWLEVAVTQKRMNFTFCFN